VILLLLVRLRLEFIAHSTMKALSEEPPIFQEIANPSKPIALQISVNCQPSTVNTSLLLQPSDLCSFSEAVFALSAKRSLLLQWSGLFSLFVKTPNNENIH